MRTSGRGKTEEHKTDAQTKEETEVGIQENEYQKGEGQHCDECEHGETREEDCPWSGQAR